MKYFLPKLLALITGKPRYAVESIGPYSGSAVERCFRIWERVFGARAGIRASTGVSVGFDEFGNIANAEYFFFSKEAILVHTESIIRRFFKTNVIHNAKVLFMLTKRIFDVRIFDDIFGGLKPAFAVDFSQAGIERWSSDGQRPIFKFSIAFDNSLYSTSSSISFTVTGANNALTVYQNYGSSGSPATFSYNSVNLTNISNEVQVGIAGTYCRHSYLNAPATGSHTLAGSVTSYVALSYTGVLQTGQPVANSGGSGQDLNSTPNASVNVVNVGDTGVVGGKWQGTVSSTDFTLRGSAANQMVGGDKVYSGTGTQPNGGVLTGTSNCATGALELQPVPSLSSGFFLFT